jgi:hypothetical protein
VSDFDRDGRADIAGAELPAVLLGQSNGRFRPAATFQVAGVARQQIAAADFNRDGNPDLAETNTNTVEVGSETVAAASAPPDRRSSSRTVRTPSSPGCSTPTTGPTSPSRQATRRTSCSATAAAPSPAWSSSPT